MRRYWVYTTKWLLAQTECLVTATGHDYDYMATPGVRDTATFVLQVYQTPSSVDFNYGDAKEAPTDIEVASILLGLAARFPEQAPAAAYAARAAMSTPNVTADGGWDVIALSLMRWDPRPVGHSSLAALPRAAFFEGHGVGVVRSGWGPTASFLGAKGGDSSTTHQDLDHGSFVWETRGYRWAVDLGIENYGLPGMFLPFSGRYQYYRKSTRGHNTLVFRDPGGFDPAQAEQSDHAVNIFSELTPGAACKPGAARHRPGCGPGEVMTINLTNAWAPQLPSGLPDPASPASARKSVTRSFHVNANMTELVVVDSISNNCERDNMTWGIHTRAAVLVSGATAVLAAPPSPSGVRRRVVLVAVSKPPGLCGGWQWAPVVLPGGTLPNNTRFPLSGAQKVWLVCHSAVSELRVALRDEG